MEQESDKRRSFLKHLVAGSVAVAGVATIGKKAQAKVSAPLSSGNEILYRESEEFKKYYKSIRS